MSRVAWNKNKSFEETYSQRKVEDLKKQISNVHSGKLVVKDERDLDTYRNKKWLGDMYIWERLSAEKIGKLCNRSQGTILGWLSRLKIPVRSTGDFMKNKTWEEIYGDQVASRKRRNVGNKLRNRVVSKQTIEKLRFKKHLRDKQRPGEFAKENHPLWSKFHSQKTIQKQSLAKLGKNNPMYGRRGENSPFFGRILLDITKRKISEANCGENNPMFGKCHTRELWKDPNYVKKTLDGRGKSPNNLEQYFDKITSVIVRFVGDGSWWRKLPNGKHKNPDFKIVGQNKVIEVFGNYWHRNDDPQVLIDLYASIGIKCLVLWEKDIKNNIRESLSKVENFTMGD